MTGLLIFLVLLTAALRFRFKDNHSLFIKLRRPFPAERTLLILSSALCFTAQETFCLFRENVYLFYSMTFMSVVVVWFVSYFLSSSILKTPITDMVLTPCLSNLRVDINRGYTEAMSQPGSYEDIAEKTAADISYLLSHFPCKTITFESHLLRPGLRKVLCNNLRERGISFTVKERITHLPETMVLNLRYGGKTRYRLFTYCKHPNGFKVHRNGGAFKIYNHKTL